MSGEAHEPFPLSRDLQVASAIGKLNLALSEVNERLEAIGTETQLCRREVAELTAFLKESLFAGDLVPRASKPSAKAQAINLGKYSGLVLGVLGIAADVAGIWVPKLHGPITALVQVLNGG